MRPGRHLGGGGHSVGGENTVGEEGGGGHGVGGENTVGELGGGGHAAGEGGSVKMAS